MNKPTIAELLKAMNDRKSAVQSTFKSLVETTYKQVPVARLEEIKTRPLKASERDEMFVAVTECLEEFCTKHGVDFNSDVKNNVYTMAYTYKRPQCVAENHKFVLRYRPSMAVIEFAHYDIDGKQTRMSTFVYDVILGDTQYGIEPTITKCFQDLENVMTGYKYL